MKRLVNQAAKKLWDDMTQKTEEFAINALKDVCAPFFRVNDNCCSLIMPKLQFMILLALQIAMNLMPLLPKEWQLKKLPETKQDLKSVIRSWSRLLLIDCANGEGFFASFQPACKVLVKGIPFGKGYLGIMQLKKDNSVQFLRMTGTADLSGVFGDDGGTWNFQIEVDVKTGHVGLGLQVFYFLLILFCSSIVSFARDLISVGLSAH
jgi:hypothetical protein